MSKYFEIDAKSKFRIHKVKDHATHIHNGIVDKTRLIYSEEDERLYIGEVSDWIAISTPYDIFDQNTKMLFGSYPLPTGWNIDTTYNDKVVLLETDAGQIGDTGGSWTITGIFGGGSHNHNINKSIATIKNWVDGGGRFVAAWYHGHFTSDEATHTHSHSPAWRPYNIRYCVGEYQ